LLVSGSVISWEKIRIDMTFMVLTQIRGSYHWNVEVLLLGETLEPVSTVTYLSAVIYCEMGSIAGDTICVKG